MVETAYERGWSTLKNGDLLPAAESNGFDVLITTDQNIRYQQNLSGRRITIIVLLTTSWPKIKQNIDLVVRVIENLQPSTYQEIAMP